MTHISLLRQFSTLCGFHNLCSMLWLNKVGRMNLKNGKKTKRRPFRFLHINAKKTTSNGVENWLSKRWCTSWQTAINFARHSQLRPNFDISKFILLRQKSNYVFCVVKKVNVLMNIFQTKNN